MNKITKKKQNEKTVEASKQIATENIDNHVYYYSDVNDENALALIRSLREVDSRLRAECNDRAFISQIPPTPIWLHVMSYGGELFAGMNIASQLKTIKSPVYSVVEGVCASAATLISMACEKRFIHSNAYMLIHQFSAFAWGTHERFKDEMALQNMIIEEMIDFYVKHSSLKRKAVRKILKHDTWFSAETALKAGIVDKIVK